MDKDLRLPVINRDSYSTKIIFKLYLTFSSGPRERFMLLYKKSFFLGNKKKNLEKNNLKSYYRYLDQHQKG